MERDYPLYHNGNPISKPRKYHKKTFNVKKNPMQFQLI